MIEKDFKIGFKNKKISLKQEGSGKDYKVQELYSFIMDLLDEPGNMKYDIPIEAAGQGEFRLVNGWAIDEKARKLLKGKLMAT